MTDEILPVGEDGGGTSASEPTTPRKPTRTRAPAAKTVKTSKEAKPAKAANVKGVGAPASRTKAPAVRPAVEVLEDDAADDGETNQAGAGLDTIATGPSPDEGGRAASARGLSGEDEDEDDLDAAPDDAEGPSPSWATGARQWVASHLPTTVLGVVAVALAVALILSLLALGNRNSLDSARTSAMSAARADAVKLAGYDYRHLDRDFGAVVADSTPAFRRRFTQADDALRNTLSKYHAVAVAHVVSAGLVSASTSRALALVFLTQKVTNSTQKNSTSDRSQVEITLVRSGGRWLIDQVSLL